VKIKRLIHISITEYHDGDITSGKANGEGGRHQILITEYYDCDITSGEAKEEGGRHVPGGAEIRKIPKLIAKLIDKMGDESKKSIRFFTASLVQSQFDRKMGDESKKIIRIFIVSLVQSQFDKILYKVIYQFERKFSSPIYLQRHWLDCFPCKLLIQI